MRTFILLILVSSLFAFSTPNHNTEIVTQSFSLQHNATSISKSSSTDDYTMSYMNKKGHYELTCEYENDMNTLLLRPKKINTTIFRRGQKQKTIQTFKIFIPKRVHCMVN